MALLAGCAPTMPEPRITEADVIGMWESPGPTTDCTAVTWDRITDPGCQPALLRLNGGGELRFSAGIQAANNCRGDMAATGTWQLGAPYGSGSRRVLIDFPGCPGPATSCSDFNGAARLVCNRWLAIQTNRGIEVTEGADGVELRVDGVRYTRVSTASDAGARD